MDRQQLRRQLLAQRRQLSPAFMQHAASQISQQIVVNPIFLRSHRIAFYLATKNELDPTPLLVRAWEMGKQCYLPILHPLSHNKLWFAPYHPNDRLVKNHYGILQPTLSSSPLLPAWALNLVIVPMVGFDSDGNRLGMGKGYYDRTFAFKKYSHRNQPLLLGIGYDMQKTVLLQPQSWDIKLDSVITETHWY